MIKANTDFKKLTPDEKQIRNVLAAGGLVPRKLKNFEQRPEQIEMA